MPPPAHPPSDHEPHLGGAAGDLPADPDAPAAGPLHLQPVMVAWVVLGGCAGTATRLGVESVVPSPGGWPLPTVVVNLAGAFLLGVVLEALARSGPDAGRRRLVRLVTGTGFCGAFTTYSSLAVDAVALLTGGRAAAAAGYLALTVLVGLAATAAGIAAAAVHHRSRTGRVSRRGEP